MVYHNVGELAFHRDDMFVQETATVNLSLQRSNLLESVAFCKAVSISDLHFKHTLNTYFSTHRHTHLHTQNSLTHKQHSLTSQKLGYTMGGTALVTYWQPSSFRPLSSLCTLHPS